MVDQLASMKVDCWADEWEMNWVDRLVYQMAAQMVAL